MSEDGKADETGTKTAGALDVRNVIGALLAIYGVILLLTEVLGDSELDKTGGVRANLWAGLALLVVGVGFLAWARIRPTVVKQEAVEAARSDDGH